MDFGKNMSIEWTTEQRWARVYMNGKLKIQFDIPTDNEVYSVRMFDPEPKKKDYKYIYEQLSREILDYKEIIVPETKYSNGSIIPEHIEYILVGTKTEYHDGDRIGVSFDGKDYTDANVKDNILSIWTVPQGDRNFDKFGRCRKYEIEKGVCQEIAI